MKLNDQQQKAVDTNEPKVLVLAGPGSGKTRTMVNRVARLINQDGCSGHDILMLTFTNKAAREMKERLSLLVPKQEISKMWIGTFHGIGLRMLKEHGDYLGYRQGLTVYDQNDQQDIIKMILAESSFRLTLNEVNRSLSNFYSWGEEPDEMSEFKEFLSQYKNFLMENNSLDFGMILVETNRLLKNSEMTLAYYSNKFQHCLIDEYQDTDNTQFILHKTIDSKNLFAVGDPDQAIYAWRGASIQIILDFQKEHPNAEIINLLQNYRSTKPIVEASNNLIANNEERLNKTTWTDEEGEEVKIKVIKEDDDIPDLLKRLYFEGFEYKEICVLARGHWALKNLGKELRSQGLPFNKVGDADDILNNFEVRQIIRCLKIIVNPFDNFSTRMIINWPEKRYSSVVIMGAMLSAMKTDSPLINVIPEMDFLVNQNKTMHLFNGLELVENKIFKNIPEDFKRYCDWWVKQTILDGEGGSIKDFLHHLTVRSMAEDVKEEEDKITLSTVHAAKGLEWKAVVIIGAEDKKFPSPRSDIEEERRLMYVAITRAAKRLVVCHSPGKRTKPAKKSRFIDEMFEAVPCLCNGI